MNTSLEMPDYLNRDPIKQPLPPPKTYRKPLKTSREVLEEYLDLPGGVLALRKMKARLPKLNSPSTAGKYSPKRPSQQIMRLNGQVVRPVNKSEISLHSFSERDNLTQTKMPQP